MDPIRPVLVTIDPPDAARRLAELLEDYFAELDDTTDPATISIVPVDDVRRGTVIYRVIQASRTVSEEFPNSTLYLVTEDGNKWRLPPPAL